MALRELAEEREVGEAEQLRDLLDREVGAAQIFLNRLHRVTVNPLQRRATRHLLRDAREVFRRDAQLLCVLLHRLHFAVVSRQQLNEALEEQVCLLQVAAVEGVFYVWRDDGEEFVDSALQQTVHYLAVVEAVRVLYLVRYDGVVFHEYVLLLLVEVYYGILGYVAHQRKEVAVHLHACLCRLVRYAHDLRFVVGRHQHVFPRGARQAYNHVARLRCIGLSVRFVLHASLRAVCHHNHLEAVCAVRLQHLVDAVEHNHIAVNIVGVAVVGYQPHVNLEFCRFVSHYV